MLGPLILQNGSSIANAQSPQLLFNHLKDSHDVTSLNLINNHQTATSSRRRSDELSMVTAERYADHLEWPVKKALTFGYTNYASRQDLNKLSSKQNSDDLFRLDTKEELAKYYFKLFPFHSTANNIFDLENEDQLSKANNRKRKLNSRKLSRKRKIGSNSTNKQLNNQNFKVNLFSKQSSIDSSSSSSSSSRRSSTDTVDNLNSNDSLNNHDNNLPNSGSQTLEEGNANGLSSYASSVEILNSRQDLDDEDGQIEKELNDDDDFSLLQELSDGVIAAKKSVNRTIQLNSVVSKNDDVLMNLVDRDLSDKQLLKSLMNNNLNSNPNKPIKFNSEFTSSSSSNLISSNQTNFIASSKLSNSSKSHSHNTSSHQLDKLGDKLNLNKNNLIDNLDLPNRDNELLDDSEDDDDNLDQYITTMSIIKKSRNTRDSKSIPEFAEQDKNLSLKKDNDFLLFPDLLKQQDKLLKENVNVNTNLNELSKNTSNTNDNFISKKKRREMNYIEHSEMLPEPAALQSSSIPNQWINSTSSSSSNPLSTTSTIIQSSSSFKNNSSNSSTDTNDLPDRPTLNAAKSWRTILFLTLKIIAISTVILLAIFGNLLVIISVLRHHKLRITTNYFVVSLACADILVALFAMTFKASLAIKGSWMFGQLVCDLWNSCDVLFSTASIMHLCCISVDRYYAIIKPLDYPMKITNKFVFIMLTLVWISSALISFIPIFTGIYTTNEVLNYQKSHPDECDFHVNPFYALISSTISFWIPCFVMLYTYYRIFLEATRQEKALYKSQMIVPQHHHRNKKKQAKATNAQLNQQTQSSNQKAQSQANINQSNLNNNDNQTNLNGKANDEEIGTANADSNVAAKNSVPEISNDSSAVGHNGARLSNTSTTTTVTTLSTSTTTTATSGPTTSSTTAQQTADQTGASATNNTNETNLIRRKSSSITTSMSTALPESQSMELKNSQINLSLQQETSTPETKPLVAVVKPQPPTSIDIQPNTVSSAAHRNSHGDDTESGQSTPTKRNINKMRREHKAAKTLGIIMGAFFICWLPFFTVYVILSICGSSCDSFPGFIVDFLFWVGYFNSSLNPIIYAYFNRYFREAFKQTIQDVFCCCLFKTDCMRNIRYQLAGQNPDRLLNNGLGGPNYARRNTTASYTGQFSTTGGGATLGQPSSNNNQLLSNSNLSMNSSLMKPPVTNSLGKS